MGSHGDQQNGQCWVPSRKKDTPFLGNWELALAHFDCQHRPHDNSGIPRTIGGGWSGKVKVSKAPGPSNCTQRGQNGQHRSSKNLGVKVTLSAQITNKKSRSPQPMAPEAQCGPHDIADVIGALELGLGSNPDLVAVQPWPLNLTEPGSACANVRP